MSTADRQEINYLPAETISEFLEDREFFQLIEGPVGSGKTVGCVMRCLMIATTQAPGGDGVRRTRFAIIRNTYPDLKSTTIKTFQEWIPESVCPIVYDVPIRGIYKQRLIDGTVVEMEVIFLALDREEDVKKLLSLELTGAFMNEAREQVEKIFTFLRGRVGRYPSKKDGGPSWWGIWGDTNYPKTSSWIYRMFEENPWPKGFKLYKQPPAVYYDTETSTWVENPDAENLDNLPAGYYQQQIEGNSEDYIRVMLACEYGMTLAGKPVFPQYSERDHVSPVHFAPDRSQPLILGFDFGLNPACIMAQQAKNGGVRILEELVPADEDLESFMLEYVNPLLHKHYAQYRILAVGDPAARGRSGLDKRTPFEVVLKFGNIRCVPAHTNSFIPRKEAVDFFLNRRDGLIIHPKLTYTREAFGGGYVYEEIKNQKGHYKERPIKNAYSHGMDAIQYICLYIKAGAARRKSQSFGEQDKDHRRFLWA